MATKHILSPIDLTTRLAYTDRVRRIVADRAAALGRPLCGYIRTFGCQQNEADSEKLAGMLAAMGYTLIDTPDKADVILVNTCAIREHAERRALSIIGQYKHLKVQNPALIIGICGCLTSQEHRREELKMRYPYVTFTLGTASLHHLPRILHDALTEGRRIITADSDEDFTTTVAEGAPIIRASFYRAWVSIMYGCNNFCAYCIVPYVRGRERSRCPADIIAEVRGLVEAGYREITLLGQNVNSYGKGTDCDFADLMRELDKIDGDWWLSFMTSHPKDASKKLIDVMAESRHIAHRFHLPLQSGNDRVLKAMNRHYDMARYLDTLRYLRERIPDVVLTSDIIVGFPGETEEEFEDTIRALESIRYDMLYSFIYSPRNGTPAAAWEQVPDTIKSARFDRLLATQNRISEERNAPALGTTIRVLCDGPGKTDPTMLSGRTEGNKIVFFPDTAESDVLSLEGHFVRVRITKTEPYALYGTLINE